MLDAEKSFDEVRQWSNTHKQDFIPVRNLRDKLKKALNTLEKQELHKKEEDWFHKKFELELALRKQKYWEFLGTKQKINFPFFTQFVRNRTQAIQDNGYLKWHYVPTSENLSVQGRRGAEPKRLGRLWFEGPNWLSSPDKWPSHPEVCETSETVVETVKPKFENQLLAKEEEKNLIVDQLLHKYSSYWKLLRVTAHVKRFVNNCKKTEKQKGPLTTEELQVAERFWITQAQAVRAPKSDVSLEKNEDGILRCVSRVPGYCPIFLPRECELTLLVVLKVHRLVLHGGVSVTTCSMREKFWVPKLRSLAKKVTQNCNVCKRYCEKPISPMTTAALPTYGVEMSDPLVVTGVDFARPVYYRVKNSVTAKAYIALFTCTGTQAVHLKLCCDLSCAEFQRALKEFIARRGCPQTLVSDNGKTFVATGKWLSTLKKDHNLASYIGALNIRWKFNLARAPWWGGFFERLIGIIKRALSKVVGRSLLTYPELEDILIDIENGMNNRPLLYQREELEQLALAPNTLLRGKTTPVLEEDLKTIGEEEVSRWMKFLQRSKEQLRRRFLKRVRMSTPLRRESLIPPQTIQNSRHWTSDVVEK